MKFFIPDAKTPDMAEQIYNAIKSFAKDTLGWNVSDRRIYRIEYYHDGKYRKAEVGKVTDSNNETVIAILESNAYLVCTPNRGVLRGMPLLVGANEARWVEDFEGDTGGEVD